MIRINEICEALKNVCGWEQSYDPAKAIDDNLTQTESGLYFQGAHPLLTLDNMAAIMPDDWGLQYPEWNMILPYKAGQKVRGANVLEKGTTNGVITDLDGNFQLQTSAGATLVVSFVGYLPAEVKAASVLNVVLKEDAQLLDDVVVIGYATGSQRTISGAVQKVGREEMNAGVVVNPLSAIKGKVAGVNIQKTGGDPTAAPAIRVRGTTSLTGGNDPLVIIDGVFGDLNMLNAISPADIENFTVLKDASETAQYGSRGASGVIVVTTIKGKNGVKSLSYDGSFGIETVYKNLEMLDANQYRAAAQNLGIDILDKGYNTNFIKEMQQTGYTQNHRLSFSNGNDDSNYRASIGVIDQKGIIKNNTMRNYTAKIDAMQNMFHNKYGAQNEAYKTIY